MNAPEPNAVIGGKYRVVRSLGEGGMGAVFEVENILTGKIEALKWMHPHLRTHEELAHRMLREARAMARIRHHNVVDIYDVVIDGDNLCLVMELLEGELLSDLIARKELFVDELVAILGSAMHGVSAAHAVGVVHRDVKPANIFMSVEPGEAGPVPKIIDFGIAKMFDPQSAQTTRSGVTMGTPRYVSYEQMCGAHNVDGRTDVYAFGVILYEALTGRAPYEASSFGEQAVQFITTEPPRVLALCPKAPARLAEIVERAIARDREERLQLEELIAQLAPFALRAAYEVRLRAFPEPPAQAPTTPATTPLPVTAGSSRSPRARRALDSGGPAHRLSGIKTAAVLAASMLGILFLVFGMMLRSPATRVDSSVSTQATSVGRSSQPAPGGLAAEGPVDKPPSAAAPTSVTPLDAGVLSVDPPSEPETVADAPAEPVAADAGVAANPRRKHDTVDIPVARQREPRPSMSRVAADAQAPSESDLQEQTPARDEPQRPRDVTAPRGGPLRRDQF